MLISGIALGIAAGLATGGRIQRLAAVEFKWWPLLVLAVLVRLAAPLVPDAAAAAYVLAFAAIVAVAVAERHLPGMWFLAGGSALNAVVVAANGGMPVDAGALAAAGAAMPIDKLHIALDAETRLAFLGDRLPIALVRGVYSIGDVALAAAGFWMPFRSMRVTT